MCCTRIVAHNEHLLLSKRGSALNWVLNRVEWPQILTRALMHSFLWFKWPCVREMLEWHSLQECRSPFRSICMRATTSNDHSLFLCSLSFSMKPRNINEAVYNNCTIYGTIKIQYIYIRTYTTAHCLCHPCTSWKVPTTILLCTSGSLHTILGVDIYTCNLVQE